MPPRRPTRRSRRGLPGAFIFMGVVSLFFGGFLPLFRLFDYAVLALVMVAAGKAFRAAVRKRYQKADEEADRREEEARQAEERERARREEEQKRAAQRAQPTTGDAAVDELILRGQQLLQQVRHENDLLPDPEISAQIDSIESVANRIFKTVIEQPQKAPQIRRFMDYYLPTTLKMLRAYRRMEQSNINSESALDTKRRIRESLDLVLEAFNKQLSKLYEDEALDIATDIDVMETMLKQDGLIDSGLKTRTSTGEEK